ncbi:MAG: ABC-F family ATP-binding cassette domain-containing protein, partial [Phycisphaerales bacterium JB063]
MASLLNARDLTKTYGTHTLFTGISIGLVQGDRLGLIGPNGAGKSTLLKILAGLTEPDGGEITRKRQLTLAYVAQDDRFPADASPTQCVVDALNALPGQDHHGLDPDTRAAITLSRLGFTDLDQTVGTLSGGWRKRLSIACAIAGEPDVLMLDEPTNHLDMEGVVWLEQFVKQADMAVVFITHDRTFLESAANRIIELSTAYPDGTFEVKGNYSAFVRRKEEFLEAQAAQQTALAGKVRRDTAWLRQGIQGRQTRNKTQVEASQARQDELKALKDRNTAMGKSAGVDFQATDRKTRKLLEAQGVAKSLGGKPLFANVDLTLSPGTRLGLLGPNGAGKTTLMRLLTGELSPDAGTITPADNLRIVNFTQHREDLDPKENLRNALCPVGDTVYFQDKPFHVSAWAKKFLFDPGKFRTSVGDLSGGEQARILIARLMLKPADLLILDEPTNDLDIPTLEVLEESLASFPGAIVLVTHDRFMLGRLSTDLLAFDGMGNAKPYADYAQWENDATRADLAPASASPSSDANNAREKQTTQGAKAKPASPPPPKPASRKLTYKLQRELDQMEDTILAAETELEALQQEASDPQVIADHTRYAEVCIKLGEADTRVRALYDRWAELEAM